MRYITSIIGLLMILIYPIKVKAVCPLCTIAVGAGLGLSRWIGIDDSITGVWVGGLIVSSGLWISSWVKSKNFKLPTNKIFYILIMALFVVPPMYINGIIGIAGNTIFSIDKIIFGSIIGIFVFATALQIDTYLRKIHNDKVFIHYQKVLLPILLLTVTSLFLYLYVTI